MLILLLVTDFEFLGKHKAYIEEVFDIINSSSHSLQEGLDYPNEAINQLLVEAIGTWHQPNLEQLVEEYLLLCFLLIFDLHE